MKMKPREVGAELAGDCDRALKRAAVAPDVRADDVRGDVRDDQIFKQ